MSSVESPSTARGNLRARGGGEQRVTFVELFFDLVYVFAITQLSHLRIRHLDLAGFAQGLLRAGIADGARASGPRPQLAALPRMGRPPTMCAGVERTVRTPSAPRPSVRMRVVVVPAECAPNTKFPSE